MWLSISQKCWGVSHEHIMSVLASGCRCFEICTRSCDVVKRMLSSVLSDMKYIWIWNTWAYHVLASGCRCFLIYKCLVTSYMRCLEFHRYLSQVIWKTSCIEINKNHVLPSGCRCFDNTNVYWLHIFLEFNRYLSQVIWKTSCI